MSIAHVPTTHARRWHVNPWLVAVIALVAGLVALGTWTLVDRYSGSETKATQTVDRLFAAVNARDVVTVRELYAKDAVFEMPTGDRITGHENVVNAALMPAGSGFRIERIAPVLSVGDYATTFFRYSNGSEGVEMVVLELRDGKIVGHWVYAHG